MWAFLLASFGATALATLFRPILAAGTRVAGGVLVRWGAAPEWLRRAATTGGLVAGADILIPDEFINPLGIPSPIPGPGGGSRPVPAGFEVSKSWDANGVPMMRATDGRMAAWSKKKGMWTIWRPKKPIVLYATGATDLRSLIRADEATHNQLKKVKKIIDRRFPKRSSPRRSPQRMLPAPRQIIESGPGSVQTGGS